MTGTWPTPLEERVADLERRVESNRVVRGTWTLIVFTAAVLALLASVVAVGFGMRAIDEAGRSAATAPVERADGTA